MVGRVLVASVITATLLSCGGEDASKEAKSPEKDQAPELNEVQLSCRADDALEIGQLNLALGPECSRNTMKFAYASYDQGSFHGYADASRVAQAAARVRACADVHCDDVTRDRVVADGHRAIDDLGHERDRAAAETANYIASKSDSCVEAPIAVQLLKVGYACGFDSGMRSALIRKEAERAYEGMATGDPSLLRAKADECVDGLTQAMRAQKN